MIIKVEMRQQHVNCQMSRFLQPQALNTDPG